MAQKDAPAAATLHWTDDGGEKIAQHAALLVEKEMVIQRMQTGIRRLQSVLLLSDPSNALRQQCIAAAVCLQAAVRRRIAQQQRQKLRQQQQQQQQAATQIQATFQDW